MNLITTTTTLFFVMDPLGNIPSFISLLSSVDEKRRAGIVVRESLFAFFILTLFLFSGQHILHGLGITEPALGVAGGLILFIIALKMIFPHTQQTSREPQYDEPFIVPLAIPLLAGPSSIATIILLSTRHKDQIPMVFTSLVIACALVAAILLFANFLRKLLGQKGLVAIERLMGMVLTTIAVQMFLTGLQQFFHLVK